MNDFLFFFSSISQPCEVKSSMKMKCPTPDVSSSARKPPYEIKKEDFGFILDGLTNYTTMSDVPGIQNFEIHPDPMYNRFDPDVLKLNIDQQKYLYLEIEVCVGYFVICRSSFPFFCVYISLMCSS